jgi:hypothetical protein
VALGVINFFVRITTIMATVVPVNTSIGKCTPIEILDNHTSGIKIIANIFNSLFKIFHIEVTIKPETAECPLGNDLWHICSLMSPIVRMISLLSKQKGRGNLKVNFSISIKGSVNSEAKYKVSKDSFHALSSIA